MMMGVTLFPFAAVVLALLGLAPSDARAAERSVARMGELRAVVSEPDWCGQTVAVRVQATRAEALTEDTRQLQRLAGGVRQILGLECPNLQQLQLTGVANGQIVGRWTHLANGRLRASATSDTVAQQAAQPLALTEPLSRAQIAELQRRLSQLGYRPGPVDGLMGRRTTRAIRAYQAANGLPQTGQPAIALAHMRGATAGGSAVQGGSAATIAGVESAPLNGEEAYPALLRHYIRAHPEAVDDPAFLPYFAGYECRAQGWRGNLNPFELREVKDAARRRLAAMRAELGGGEAMPGARIAFTARLRLADYDFERQSFPILPHGSIEGQIRPGDFCQSVARQEGLRLHDQKAFPSAFRVTLPAGEQALEAAGVAALLGGRLAMPSGAAEELYASDFPNISVIVTGRVEGVTRATQGHSLVQLRPLKAEVRTPGNPQYSRQLAVLGADALTLPEPQSAGDDAPVVADSLQGADLTGSALLVSALHESPALLDDPRTAARYAYWDGERGCIPEANLRGKANAEFERQRLLEAAPQRAASKLAEASVHNRFHATSEGELQEYDTERGAFGLRIRLSSGRPDDATERFRFSVTDRARIPDCVTRDGPDLPRFNSVEIRDEGLLAAVPKAAGPAEQLVKANPERQVSIQLELRLVGFERAYGKIQGARMELLRGRVFDAVSGELLKEVTLEQVNAARPASSLWEDYAELDYRALFLHLVRGRPALAERSDYVDAYMRVEACNRVRDAEGNPITMARLQQEFRTQLAEAVEMTGRRYVRVAFPNEVLGQYDMDAERFPFTSRRGDISFYRQVHSYQLNRYCRPGDDSEVPQAFSLALDGMEPLIEAGLPMESKTAETFLERFNGRKDGRERQVTIEVLASLGTPPAPGAEQASESTAMPATVHAMRVLDRKDDSVLFQAGELPGEDGTEVVEAEAQALPPGAAPTEVSAVDLDASPERESLALVGVSLGMEAEQARQALTERFSSEAISWPDEQTIAAEEGNCLYHGITDPRLAEEVGAACAKAEFNEDGLVRHVYVRNVVEGEQTAALEELLVSRFGSPGDRVKDAETETLILAWGDPLAAPPEVFGRSVSAGQSLLTLEGRISEAHGLTLVALRLDAPPPESAAPEAEVPEIRF
ncbi:peptidoglycan-binding protein [Halomonas sp. SL1]|uniref:peptidoglycan-binding protein n=1 Tax=Halomonas sp. SL1 TaxID=2137478 RepID=UPI000D15DD91|nr:DUF4852 domain-containing protein [Halomonas sp. SL1]RAH36674.1 DUF4852 domain-containing protein [Halomonas sp. SL1]